MNLFYKTNLIGKLSNLFLVYSPLFIKMRHLKDQVFAPLSSWCDHYHIKPWLLSTVGLLFGLISLPALFINYWYFVALMSVSLLFDVIDGSLARCTQQVSNFGKYLDFIIDHILMILMVFFLCHYLKSYYWLIGAGFFSIALYINVLTFTPVHIPSGRITLFTPCLFAAPQLGLTLLTLYGFILAALMFSEWMSLANKPRPNRVAVKRRS